MARFEKPLDRRVKRSRKLMQDALLELLTEKAYAKISVSEITDRADVARTTFYSHFQSKDELLLSYIDDIFGTFFNKLQARYPVSQTPHLEHEISLILLKEWRKNKAALDLIRSANVDYLIFKRIKENQQSLFQEEVHKVLGTSSNPAVEDYMTSFIAGTIFAILMEWTDREMQDTPEAVAKLLFRLIQRKSLNKIREEFEADLTASQQAP